jgi:hypothetical protein
MKQSTWKQNTQKISVLLFGLTLLLLSAASISFAQDITLAWDANQESDVAFYNIYFRDVETQSTWQEPGPVHDPSTIVVSHQILGLDGTRQHCFKVTALNDSGIESLPSEETCTTATPTKPGAPPFGITSPVDGTTLTSGATSTISWTADAGADSYRLYYFDNDRTAHFIKGVGNVTSFDWTVPDVAALESGKQLRVTSFAGGIKQNVAWQVGSFSIEP